MGTKPIDISAAYWDLLEEHSKASGRTKEELITDALNRYFSFDIDWMRAQENSFAKVWDNNEDSVFDSM